MLPQITNSLMALLMAKFLLNDLPHASGLLANPDYERPPTGPQLHYIAVLCQQLKITVQYEEQVKTIGEAGRMIRELEAERKYRKKVNVNRYES